MNEWNRRRWMKSAGLGVLGPAGMAGGPARGAEKRSCPTAGEDQFIDSSGNAVRLLGVDS